MRPYEHTEAANARLVELRVHGVGGIRPEDLLTSDDVVQVRGDETAGFFRRRVDSVPGQAKVREAYSWGGLTSQGWTRALWVLLAPFALINVAGWMLLKAKAGRERWRRLAEGLIRVIGLYLTVVAITWIASLTADYAAYQCGGQQACRESYFYLEFFEGAFFSEPGRRYVVGALIPLVLLFVLWQLSHVSRGRYEAEYPFDNPEGPSQATPAHEIREDELDSFADDTFWKRSKQLGNFASLHLAAGLAALAWMMAGSGVWFYRMAEADAALSVSFDGATELVLTLLSYGAAVLLLVVAVACGVYRPLRRDGSEASEAAEKRDWRLSHGLLYVSMLVWAAAALAVLVWPAENSRVLEAANRAWIEPVPAMTNSLLLVMFGVAALFITSLFRLYGGKSGRTVTYPCPLEECSDPTPVGFGRFGSLVALFTGYLFALTMLGGLGSGVARMLGGQGNIAYPVGYEAYGIGVLILAIVLVLAAILVWLFHPPEDLAELHQMYPDEHGRRPPENRVAEVRQQAELRSRRQWLKDVQRRRSARKLVSKFETPFAIILSLGFLLMAVDLGGQAVERGRLSNWVLDVSPRWLAGMSTWIMAVGVPIGMVWLVRRTFRSQTARKTVAKLWDVLTLWPRWYHPLAPPSYAGRAVPELRTRLDVLSRQSDECGDTRVILSAHSQGSVLALAALDGLRNRNCFHCVSLVTHGSPIGRLYLRYFPYQIAPSISRLSQRWKNSELPRWINLYRLTDPIGGAVAGEDEKTGTPLASGPPDYVAEANIFNPIDDPNTVGLVEHDRFPRPGDPYPKPQGHSDYYDSPEYERAIAYLTSGTPALQVALSRDLP